jgi:hypothetical protein
MRHEIGHHHSAGHIRDPVRGASHLVEQDNQERHQMTRDQAFAQGFWLAWRSIPIGVLTIVMGFAVICLLGAWFEQIEAANAFLRAFQ